MNTLLVHFGAFKCLGISGLNDVINFSWFLVPPLIYDALAEIKMLHSAPLVIYKQNYREHDMRADGLLIGAEMDMNFLRNTGWHGNGQFISC